MDTTVIIINLSPYLQKFLRFYYKCKKPFFYFPDPNPINNWISDNIQEFPSSIPINFSENTFKMEVPLLFGQDPEKRYHVNTAFMILFKHRMSLLMKDYYNQRFEESTANHQNVDLTIINIMNELEMININSIIELEGLPSEIDEKELFILVKEIIMKNNRTEFEMIAKKFTRWKNSTRFRKFYAKDRKKLKRKKAA